MTEAEAQLRHGAARILGRSLTDDEARSLSGYLELLASWNRIYRMVGSSEAGWLVENVVLDSLLFLRALPSAFASLLDIGSGAGVPGIPIKIVRPTVSLVMAESRRKPASFLLTVIRSLGLTGASVVHGRAETLIEDGRRFDAVVSRCAGEAITMLDLGSRLVSEGGTVVVAGSPGAVDLSMSRSVRLVNPVTGAPRHFLVR